MLISDLFPIGDILEKKNIGHSYLNQVNNSTIKLPHKCQKCKEIVNRKYIVQCSMVYLCLIQLIYMTVNNAIYLNLF